MAKQMADSGAGQEKVDDFLNGEGFKKNPEPAIDYLKGLPHIPVKAPFVVLEPLSKMPPGHTPEVVIMPADAIQVSALVCLANFGRRGLDNVRVPFSAGCESIGVLPMSEAAQENPKAVVGLTDLLAGLYLKLVGRDLLSFAMPLGLYQEIEITLRKVF